MRNILKVLFMALVTGLFIMRPVSSYADWHDRHGHDGGYSHGYGYHDRSYVGLDFSYWPDNYYYGAPYYPYPPDEVLVSPPVVVAQQPVEIVQQPQVVVNQDQSSSAQVDSVTINIPNKSGSYTAVTLKRSGNGYIGPQGEFYPEFPKVSQLEVIYGK